LRTVDPLEFGSPELVKRSGLRSRVAAMYSSRWAVARSLDQRRNRCSGGAQPVRVCREDLLEVVDAALPP